MRFEELSYREYDAPVAVSFHVQLTVIGPLGARARSRWVDRLLGVLLGTRPGDGTTAQFAEASGQRVRLERDHLGGARVVAVASGEERMQAGVELPLDGRFDWFASIGLDTDEACGIVRLDASAFRRDDDLDVWQLEDDLVQARQELGRAETEYQAAMAQVQRVAELYQRVAGLDARIGALEGEQARRRRREARAAVRRQEEELNALRRAVAAERTQREAVLAAARAGAEWRRSSDSLEVARVAFGSRRRLDPEELRRALALPNELPAGLEELEVAYRRARGRRAELPQASAPFVLTLACRDQQDLWARAERLRTAVDRVAEVTPDPECTELQLELETAHRAVEAAERNLEGARLPVLAVSARRELARAQRQELAVLARLGFPSWFAYQMQRVDALLAQDVLEAVRVAEADQQEALAAWKEVAGEVEVEAALAARTEIERCAAAPQPIEEVEPAYAEARTALLAAYRPFGVTLLPGVPDLDLEAAAAEVRDLVTRAQDARLQHTLEEAEGICRAAAERLRQSLAEVDRLNPGGPDELTAMVEWVMELAAEARSGAPTPLARRMAALEAEVEAARSALAPERDGPSPDEADESSIEDGPLPDPEILQAERAELFEEAYHAERSLPDVARLEERRRTLAGEVARLENAASLGYQLLGVDEAEMVLVDRVAAASRAGAMGEPVPLLVDDALAAFDRRDRRDLLRLLARLGEATQIVYFTEDAATLEWAAVAAQAGEATVIDARSERFAPNSREVA